MKIQLLTFPGCPHAAPARDALAAAIALEQLTISIEEVDVSADDAPAWTRGWGSPTILVDGVDLAEASPASAAVSCRLYVGGAPSVAQIRACLVARR